MYNNYKNLPKGIIKPANKYFLLSKVFGNEFSNADKTISYNFWGEAHSYPKDVMPYRDPDIITNYETNTVLDYEISNPKFTSR